MYPEVDPVVPKKCVPRVFPGPLKFVFRGCGAIISGALCTYPTLFSCAFSEANEGAGVKMGVSLSASPYCAGNLRKSYGLSVLKKMRPTCVRV